MGAIDTIRYSMSIIIRFKIYKIGITRYNILLAQMSTERGGGLYWVYILNAKVKYSFIIVSHLMKGPASSD